LISAAKNGNIFLKSQQTGKFSDLCHHNNMERLLTTPELLAARHERLLLDVRSPGEYAQGHIPGAVSFPLFTDQERAAVGTLYKQQGPEQALELGLTFVGPKMAGFVTQARALAPEKRLAVHCWRGGKRSQSVAWLLRQAGFDVATLSGGYKFYRRRLLEAFDHEKYHIVVLGGRTGAGKTKVLRTLRDLGEQTIDLEALAHHKGSAFGSIGEAPQPTAEQFENNLYDALLNIDPQRRVWLENESRSIGRVYLPAGFWAQMKAAPLLNIEIPLADRVQNLIADYTVADKAALEAAFLRIDKKLGGQHLKVALEALAADDLAAAAEIALRYYDKTYQHCLDVSTSPDIWHLPFEHADPVAIAQACIASLNQRRYSHAV
jgi:tRNA 2-selenouridine synthase